MKNIAHAFQKSSLLLCLLLMTTAAWPQAAETPFRPAEGIATLEKMSEDLSEGDLDEQTLLAMRTAAAELEKNGEACGKAYGPQIERLRAELEVLGEPDPNEEIDIWERRRKTTEDLARISSAQSNCQLLVLRAQDFRTLADGALNRLAAKKMWSRGPSLLIELEDAVEAMHGLPGATQISASVESRFDVPAIGMLLVAVVLTVLSVALGFRIKQRFYDWAHRHKLDEGPPTLKFLLPRPPAENAPLIFTGAVLSAYAYVAAKEPSLQLYAIRLPLGLLLYGLGVVLIRWSTNKLSPSAQVEGLAPDHIPALRARIRASLLVLVAGFVLLGPNWLGGPPQEALLFPYILLGLALIGCLMSILILARQIKGTKRRFRLIRLIASVALLVGAGAALAGYYNFANYLLTAVLTTMLAAFFLWLLLWMTGSIAQLVAKGGTRFSHRMRTWLGLSPTDPDSGLGIYNLVADLFLWASAIVIVVNAWDTSDRFPGYVASVFAEGIEVGSVRIVPMHILYGLIAFVGILIGTGWVKQAVQKRYIRHTRMDRGARDALLKITGYVGFVVAALVGLKLTGISFAGLAIVAGALSVGIGFGLQNIVSNFVSGLILLFERPIKSGDFVTVGGVEGTVKSISIRATEIETLDRQNILVPNSELVSQQVTNWVLHDPIGRLILDIGVAYGSDVEKVRTILEEVATGSEYVITDGVMAPKPKALFMSFGDSSLNFELRVWIRQIRRRFDATSDLHFAVDKAFRENGVEIPFPQRDLHVRSWAEHARPAESRGVEHAGRQAPAKKPDTGEDGTG